MEFIINDETTVQQLADFFTEWTEDGRPNPINLMEAVKLAYHQNWPNSYPDGYLRSDIKGRPADPNFLLIDTG